MLEEPEDLPPCVAEQSVVSPIALNVASKLGLPVAPIRPGNLSVLRTAMPKASVDEYCHLGAGENHIGSDTSRLKLERHVLAKPKTQSMQF